MKTIDKTKPVLVTGATGYLASWIIKQLLEKGNTVHGTVRNLSNKEKYNYLLEIEKNSPGKLQLFEADLLIDNSFGNAMENCELVIHTASPFKITGIKNAQKELINPALQGTRNVLHSANKSETVKRVVLTSSVVAIFGDSKDIETTENGKFTEEHWNTTSSENHQPYPYSKTLAEKEAWKIAESQEEWDLVVINPGFILGPSLNKNNYGTSTEFMADMGNGKYKTGIPNAYHGVVDVRDVAKAHILAGFTPNASGRHVTTAHKKSFVEMANVLHKKFPDYPLPKNSVPKPLVWIIAPLFGLSRKYVTRNFNIDIDFDNSYIKKDLGIEFLPFEKTLTEHFEQLVEDGVIKKRQ